MIFLSDDSVQYGYIFMTSPKHRFGKMSKKETRGAEDSHSTVSRAITRIVSADRSC